MKSYDIEVGTYRGHVEEFDSIESTHSYLKELYLSGRKNVELQTYAYYLARAHQQHAGIGSHGKTWDSPRGGLYVSSLIHANVFPSVHEPALTSTRVMAYTLSIYFEICAVLKCVVRQWCDESCVENCLKIKWPNDIVFVHPQQSHSVYKVAGMLFEQLQTSSNNCMLWSLGINVNSHTDSFTKGARLHYEMRKITLQDIILELAQLCAAGKQLAHASPLHKYNVKHGEMLISTHEAFECFVRALGASHDVCALSHEEIVKCYNTYIIWKHEDIHLYNAYGQFLECAEFLGVDRYGRAMCATRKGLRSFNSGMISLRTPR